MMNFKSVMELQAENKELQEQLEQLYKDRYEKPHDLGYYMDKTKEMYQIILSMKVNEYYLYELIGNEAPVIAPFMYEKYGIDYKNMSIL